MLDEATMQDLQQRLIDGYVFTREELGEMLDEFLPDTIPHLMRAGALLAINNIPTEALPELTEYIQQAIESAGEGGVEGLIEFLRSLDCPEPLIAWVRRYAEESA